jgi:hypothetical protein
MCAIVSATSTAGNTSTCTAYQRVSVSAPISAPPRSNAARKSPASGVSLAMLIVTVVAQYAR